MLSLTDDGSTILHAAVLSHNAVVVRYALHLMDRAQGDSLPGSDVNARNAKGESALELASRSGMCELHNYVCTQLHVFALLMRLVVLDCCLECHMQLVV